LTSYRPSGVLHAPSILFMVFCILVVRIHTCLGTLTVQFPSQGKAEEKLERINLFRHWLKLSVDPSLYDTNVSALA